MKGKKKLTMTEYEKNLKTSFEPISDAETTILLLGTMPGEISLQHGEYYANPRNKFWEIISKITNNELPQTYSEKKSLLLKTKIGVWDVAKTANRKGSLDSAIKEEKPNDLDNFIAMHKKIKVIGFNGKKAAQLFDRYFSRKKEIKYISLPSTSPANASLSFDRKCEKWQQIKVEK
ncbi:MAG: DNA-deoxyinosine glycosylase [Candidatus Symbiothrix sp.]|nr:DNA-deoxyinosine glycosylase [Candidatus Symbiothrix sp.]